MGALNNVEMKLMTKLTGKNCQTISCEQLADMFKELFITEADFELKMKLQKAAKGSRFRKHKVTSKSGRYIFRSSRKRGLLISSRIIYIEDTKQKNRYYLERSGYHKKFYKLVEQNINL